MSTHDFMNKAIKGLLFLLFSNVSAWSADAVINVLPGDAEYAQALKFNWEIPAQERAAWQWISRAATLGHPKAQVEMAEALIGKPGAGDTDRKEALRWLNLAAQKNYAVALNLIGAVHVDEFYKGWPKDYGEAAKWFLRSANLGNGTAQYNLAQLFWKGNGVTRDKAESYKWMSLAVSSVASEKDEFDPRNHGVERVRQARERLVQTMVALRDSRARSMSASEIADGERRALAFKAPPAVVDKKQ